MKSTPWPAARRSTRRWPHKSCEVYDTGIKAEAYRNIPSLEEYIVVSHRERRVTVHHRRSDRGWDVTVAIAGGVAQVRSLATQLVVDEVYRGSTIC